MGIYSRDYFHDGPVSRRGGWPQWSVCTWIIVLNVAIFLLQNVTLYVQYWLELDPLAVAHGQLWRLVTYSFCHSRQDLLHILFNMLFVWWFGRVLEDMYGSREFLLFYLTAALVAGLSFVGLHLFVHDLRPAIGASGAVMAIVMVYALYYPRQRIYLWALFPIEIRWLVLAYVVFDGWPVLQSLAGGQMTGGVAHAAHLGGLAFGFAYKRYGWRLEDVWSRVRFPRGFRFSLPKRRFRVVHPPDDDYPPDFDEQVDRVLKKIHDFGEASLTDEERELLKKASRRYRSRSGSSA